MFGNELFANTPFASNGGEIVEHEGGWQEVCKPLPGWVRFSVAEPDFNNQSAVQDSWSKQPAKVAIIRKC